MRHALLVPILLLCALPAQARDVECSVHSDYDLTLTDRSVIMTRDSGAPRRILIREGRLFIDDRWVDLVPEDRKRVAAFDRQARQIMPLARELGRDAADIAFSALGEVAAGLSNQPAQTRARLDKARGQIDARMARAVTVNRFDGRDLGEGIGEVIGEVMPALVGDIVGGAVSAALAGDVSRLQAMQDLDQRIEARVAPRAKALQRRADALCLQMVELDRLDDALAYRLPDGRPLDLLQASRHAK